MLMVIKKKFNDTIGIRVVPRNFFVPGLINQGLSFYSANRKDSIGHDSKNCRAVLLFTIIKGRSRESRRPHRRKTAI